MGSIAGSWNNGVPRFLADGSFAGYIGSAIDISPLKQAEAALRKNEEHLRRVYENSPLAYQSLDAQGRFLDVNPAWCTMTGYARDEVIDRSFAEFLAPPSVLLLRPRFSRFKADGEIHGVEFDMVRRDGTSFTIELHGKMGYDNQGCFRQTHCILHDVTERKHLVEEMRRSAAAIEQAAETIIISDPSSVIQYVNPAFTTLTGYTREEVVGQRASMWRAPRSRILPGHVGDAAARRDLARPPDQQAQGWSPVRGRCHDLAGA
jgi:PAS domain S-box-containing protein